MNVTEGPIVRMLAVMLMIAVGIRLVFELIAPVAPYVVAGAVVLALLRLISWYRDRW